MNDKPFLTPTPVAFGEKRFTAIAIGVLGVFAVPIAVELGWFAMDGLPWMV